MKKTKPDKSKVEKPKKQVPAFADSMHASFKAIRSFGEIELVAEDTDTELQPLEEIADTECADNQARIYVYL